MMSACSRAVFLDRDGVLNRAVIREGKPYSPSSIEDLEILLGVRESLLELKLTGFLLIVVTNQPDVGRGIQSRSTVEAQHSRLRRELPLDDILVCYHTDSDQCNCRKPAPGLLVEAGKLYQLHLSDCYMIGDRWRDIDAGYNAGCRPILIDYGYQEQAPHKAPVAVVKSLPEAAKWILRTQRGFTT